MFDPKVFEQREQFCRQVAAVGNDYLRDNAQGLFLINNELSRSLMLEFRIIQQVSHLDIGNRGEVEEFLVQLEDYVQRAVYDNERTRCSLIGRAWWKHAESKAFGGSSEQKAAAELERLIEIFRRSDNDFIDQVEAAVHKARDVVRVIADHVRSGNAVAANTEQQRFAESYQAELARLKASLRQLNQTATDLIDKL
jgi:hypothetical protein